MGATAGSDLPPREEPEDQARRGRRGPSKGPSAFGWVQSPQAPGPLRAQRSLPGTGREFHSRRLVGRGPPHPPLGLILGGPPAAGGSLPAVGPRIPASGTPCGAKPRGGGGAPPTNLILLRNQCRCVPRRDRRAHTATGGPRPLLRRPRGASRTASAHGSRRVTAGPPASPRTPRLRLHPRGASWQDPVAALPAPPRHPTGCRLAFHWPPVGSCGHIHPSRVAPLRVRQLLRNLALSRPEPNPRGLRPTAKVIDGPLRPEWPTCPGGCIGPLPWGLAL